MFGVCILNIVVKKFIDVNKVFKLDICKVYI